jgi:pimeloyl-ACP methyl ester carboxylesterase
MAVSAFYPYRSEATRAEYEAYAAARAAKWPVACATTEVESAWGRTFVRISGLPGNPPLVLLPGARVGSLMWIDSIASLARGHRTYALDIIDDVGFSRGREPISRMADYVTWLDEVLQALVPGTAVSLLGISLGGAIAAHYALRHPERLRAVVLVAPAGVALRFSLGFVVRFTLLSLPIRALGGSPLRRTCEWLFADALAGDAACRVRAEQAIADAQMAVRVFALRPPPWPAAFSDAEWRGFRTPCLFLVGEHEKVYSARGAVRRLHRVAPQVKTAVVPAAGHDLTIVDPIGIARRAVAFLAECESAAGVDSQTA